MFKDGSFHLNKYLSFIQEYTLLKFTVLWYHRKNTKRLGTAKPH